MFGSSKCRPFKKALISILVCYIKYLWMGNIFFLITCAISRKIETLSLKMLKPSHVNMFKVIFFVRTYTTMNVLHRFNKTEITRLSLIKIVALFKQQSMCHNLLTRIRLIQVSDVGLGCMC